MYHQAIISQEEPICVLVLRSEVWTSKDLVFAKLAGLTIRALWHRETAYSLVLDGMLGLSQITDVA